MNILTISKGIVKELMASKVVYSMLGVFVTNNVGDVAVDAVMDMDHVDTTTGIILIIRIALAMFNNSRAA